MGNPPRRPRPISIASGAVGFAQYARYLVPALHGWQLPMLAAAVCGMNTLLLESELQPEQRKHVETSYRNVRRLLNLINGILDLSKIEAGKLELRPETFNSMDALNEVVSSVAPLAATNNAIRNSE